MARSGGRVLDLVSDDDLIEIDPTPAERLRGSLANLLNPFRPDPPAQSRRADRQRSSRLESPRRLTPWDDSPPPNNQQAPFIDLTGEPESPAGRQNSQSQGSGRNPRRTGSQRASPPRLARSDSTLVSPGTSFINLTADSPEDNGEAELWRQAGTQHHHHRRHHHHHHGRAHLRPGFPDQLIELELSDPRLFTNIARGVEQITGLLGPELLRGGLRPRQLNIADAFGPRETSPKPLMDVVPFTRDGYTRDTCSGSEGDGQMVTVCPACREELAYDPTDAGGQGASGSGSKKRKKTAGEHHFWALKKCGHVYCADCFENRRPTKASPNRAGFPGPGGKTPASTPAELRCAVEDCETKVAAKTEWIGIFL